MVLPECRAIFRTEGRKNAREKAHVDHTILHGIERIFAVKHLLP